MDNQADPREDCFANYVPVAKVSRRYYPILSPEPGQEVKAIITSDFVLHAFTHFQNKVTYPCTRSPKSCPWCRNHIAARNKGYLCGLADKTCKAVIVELTSNALQECPRLLDETKSLRGITVCLFRRGKARNSPVTARLMDTPPSMLRYELPHPFALKRALLDMWGFPERIINVETGEATDVPTGDLFPDISGPYDIPC